MFNKIKKVLVILLVGLMSDGLTLETSQVFVVDFYWNKVVVTSPIKFSNELQISIENKTLGSLVGKLIDSEGRDILFVTVPSNEGRVISINWPKDKIVYFIPLSPASQKISLIYGKKSYEIPRKEKN